MSFGWSASEIATLLKLAKETYERFKDAPGQFKEFESEATGLWTVLCSIENVLSEHDGLTEWQKQYLSNWLTECHKLLMILDKEIYKNHLLGSKDTHGLLDRSGRVWRRLTWDQKKVKDFRSRVSTHVTILNALSGSLPSKVALETQSMVNQLHTRHDERDRLEGNQAILDWLDATDYALQQSDFLDRRQEGTCEWLPNSTDFQSWLQTKGDTIFCPGMPGAGKTIQTAVVIDDLMTRFSGDPDIGIAYIYCSFKSQREQSARDLLTSLLKQLCQKRSTLPESLDSLYKKHYPNGTRPSLLELSTVLGSVVALYSRAFIIIDALDECPTVDDCRGKLLSSVFNLQKNYQINVFATSRDIPDVMVKFKGKTHIEVQASEQDVQQYLSGHISVLPEWVQLNSGLLEEIKAGIAEAVKGMFLLAQLYLYSLSGKATIRDIRTNLRKLPTGSGAYDSAYDDAMKRIDDQHEDRKKLAHRTLSWIVYAMRPFTVDEVRHALAVEAGDTMLDPDNMCSKDYILSVCAGLVTIDQGSDIIRLVHYTAQEYFEQNQDTLFPNANDDILNTCITYLSFSEFENGPCQGEVELKKRLESHKLYDYAAKNWGYHARKTSPHSHDLVINFLGIGIDSTGKGNFESSSQAFIENGTEYAKPIFPRSFPTVPGRLDIAAYFGLLYVVKHLLDLGGSDVDADYLGTSVSWAASAGHTSVVQLLLENGANFHAESQKGMTPLCRAAKYGHSAVVRLLLDKGADPNRTDMGGEAPLVYAIVDGNEDIAKLLLDKQADYEIRSRNGHTPLSIAAIWGSVAIAGLLLDAGADPSAKHKGGHTPTHASAVKSETVAKLFIERQVNLEVRDDIGLTPLFHAAGYGNVASVRLLLEAGADIDAKNVSGDTALTFSIWLNREDTAKCLLDMGASVQTRNVRGETPLFTAVAYDRVGIAELVFGRGAGPGAEDLDGILRRSAVPAKPTAFARLLLEYGADPNAVARCSVLWLVVRLGDEPLVRLLLEYGARPEVRNEADDHTPLIVAACEGHESIAKLLIEKGADLEAKDTEYEATALLWAVAHDKPAMVRLLRDSGANIEAGNKLGRTPLAAAVLHLTEDMVTLLLELGADPGSRDPRGRTPLSLAASSGSKAKVRILLDHFASIEKDPMIDSADVQGRTPLSHAAQGGHEAVMRLLLDRGAEINAQDDEGTNALYWAGLFSPPGVETLLRERGAIEPEDVYGFRRLFESLGEKG